MAVTEISAFERFAELSDPIQVDYVVARRATPKLIEQLESSSLRVSKYLAGVAELCVGDEAKSTCVQPDRKVAQLFQKLESVKLRLEKHEQKCKNCAALFHQWRDEIQGQLAEAEKIERLSDEDRELCRRFGDSSSPDNSTWTFFAAIPAISLCNALCRYVDLMSALIGQPKTSHSITLTGISTLVDSNMLTTIDHATFNFGSALLFAAQANLTEGADLDINSIQTSQNSLRDVLAFEDALARLDAQTHLVEAVLTTAEAAVDHAIADTNTIATNVTGRLRTLLGLIKPQVF